MTHVADASAMHDLRVTLVQLDTRWHDPERNRAHVDALLAGHAGQTDLVVLPETFTTGFSNAAVATAESPDGPTAAWMRELARGHGAAVTGSIQCRAEGGVFNRLLFATPDGAIAQYDKRHLFRMGREHEHYASGRQRIVVEHRGWRICPLVCYDLRFPVFSRNRADPARGGEPEYDLLLYVANWPAPRHEAWRTLLRARAIENLCCTIGVNRAGIDGNGIPHLGGSAVIDSSGRALVECSAQERVEDAVISLAAMREHRRRFPAHMDADGFTLDG
jgi:omega-amidase